MAAYFFDSSAIVKRYVREPGTAWVQATCEPRNHPPIYLSHIAQVEVVAALRRVGRTQRLHPSFVDAMVRAFERHITLSVATRPASPYRIIPATPSILTLAAALCNQYWQVQPHPLRSLDAIQLACALAAAANSPDEVTFVTADARLAAIAPLEGFLIINPAFPQQP